MAKTTWTEARDPQNCATREFHIERDGQRPVTGALWLPEDPQPGRALLALGHGASGDRYQAPNPYMARRMGEAGYVVLAIDGPVHGLRQVGPGGREALALEMRRPECIDDMLEDWRVALGATQELDEVGRGPLAYVGLSMGSMFGIPLIAARDDVQVAVLGLLGTSGAAAAFRERFLKDASAISCPLFFMMQLEDELFPRDGYLELFDAFASVDKRVHANPGLHPEIPAEEIDFAIEFLRSQLEGRAKRRIINPLAE